LSISTTWQQRVQQATPLARTFGATTGIGALLGLVVGGIGGRLAMRLLFLTSGDEVRGVVSDDGFAIGQFTLETLNLLVTGAAFGVIGAFTYLAVRPFMLGRLWLRAATCGVAAGAVVGSTIVAPHGVDFTALSPPLLAAALFIAIPALFAVLTTFAVEWALRPGGWAETAPLKFLGLPLLVFLFPPLLVLIGVPTAIVLGVRWGARQWSAVGAVVHHRAPFWLFRVAWAGIAAAGVFGIVDDLLTLE
jgi:hypothetical protein